MVKTPPPSTAAAKPKRPIASTSSGTTSMAPKLAPVSAIATLRPWCRSNHGAMVAVRPVSDSEA